MLLFSAGYALNDQLLLNPYSVCTVSYTHLDVYKRQTLVRKLGWEGDDKLKIFWGIIVPGLFGLLTLLFSVNWIKIT